MLPIAEAMTHAVLDMCGSPVTTARGLKPISITFA